MTNLSASHGLQIALVHPQIAPNTGNIGRLCVAAGIGLHLVRPLGFVLNHPALRRSAMDYWPRLQLTIHDDLDAFLIAPRGRMWFFSSKSRRSQWDVAYAPGDCLVFGSETKGLDEELLERFAESSVRIPQVQGERCLNLATAAGIAAYEALRQLR